MPGPASEGTVSVDGGRLFYRSFGAPTRGTIVGLHGGPGASLDYLMPLADLSGDGYRVVLFDQLGCGRSELPGDPALFSLEHHVLETEGLRDALELGRVHLIGSSYGGLLAIAYTLAHPDAVRSLVTVGGLASVPFAVREMQRLVGTLPPETRRAIAEHADRGEFTDPEYLAAVDRFYRTFLCRLPVWPPPVTESLRWTSERPVYARMNGPNEFTITGTIRDIDLTPRLGEIRVPTLVLGGRYDEVTPRVAEQIRAGIPGARRVEFPESSHLPFWEEPVAFRAIVRAFFEEVP